MQIKSGKFGWKSFLLRGLKAILMLFLVSQVFIGGDIDISLAYEKGVNSPDQISIIQDNISAGTKGSSVAGFAVKVFSNLIQVFMFLLLLLVDLLTNMIQYLMDIAYYYPPWIHSLWQNFRNIALVVAVFIFMVSTIIIAGNFMPNAYTPKLLIERTLKSILLIVFSFTIPVLILDQFHIAEAVIYDLGPASTINREAGVVNFAGFMDTLNPTSLFYIPNVEDKGVFANSGFGNELSLMLRSMAGFIFLFMLIPVLGAIVAAYVVRDVGIWILLAVAPIAALGWMLPEIQGATWGKWWKTFLTFAKMGVVLAGYFVVISYLNVGAASNAFPIDESSVGGTSTSTLNTFSIFSGQSSVSLATIFQNILIYIASIILLMQGLKSAISNEYTNKAIEKGSQWASKARDKATQWTRATPFMMGQAAKNAYSARNKNLANVDAAQKKLREDNEMQAKRKGRISKLSSKLDRVQSVLDKNEPAKKDRENTLGRVQNLKSLFSGIENKKKNEVDMEQQRRKSILNGDAKGAVKLATQIKQSKADRGDQEKQARHLQTNLRDVDGIDVDERNINDHEKTLDHDIHIMDKRILAADKAKTTISDEKKQHQEDQAKTDKEINFATAYESEKGSRGNLKGDVAEARLAQTAKQDELSKLVEEKSKIESTHPSFRTADQKSRLLTIDADMSRTNEELKIGQNFIDQGQTHLDKTKSADVRQQMNVGAVKGIKSSQIPISEGLNKLPLVGSTIGSARASLSAFMEEIKPDSKEDIEFENKIKTLQSQVKLKLAQGDTGGAQRTRDKIVQEYLGVEGKKIGDAIKQDSASQLMEKLRAIDGKYSAKEQAIRKLLMDQIAAQAPRLSAPDAEYAKSLIRRASTDDSVMGAHSISHVDSMAGQFKKGGFKYMDLNMAAGKVDADNTEKDYKSITAQLAIDDIKGAISEWDNIVAKLGDTAAANILRQVQNSRTVKEEDKKSLMRVATTNLANTSNLNFEVNIRAGNKNVNSIGALTRYVSNIKPDDFSEKISEVISKLQSVGNTALATKIQSLQDQTSGEYDSREIIKLLNNVKTTVEAISGSRDDNIDISDLF